MGDRTMYGERAELYDRIYAFKDYGAETARVRAVLAAAGVGDGSRVIEAACGTGNYSAALAKHYDVTGFDLSDDVLAIARRKVPAATFFRADMTDFAVERPADALVCLFSSIGYVEPSRLPATAACFHRAVRPGGVAIVEPWFTPEEVVAGRTWVSVYDGWKAATPEPLHLVRANTHRVEGRKSVLDFHWIVARPERVEHFTDLHELWQSTGDELTSIFGAAGFAATWLSPGPITGRGTLLLRRPA